MRRESEMEGKIKISWTDVDKLASSAVDQLDVWWGHPGRARFANAFIHRDQKTKRPADKEI